MVAIGRRLAVGKEPGPRSDHFVDSDVSGTILPKISTSSFWPNGSLTVIGLIGMANWKPPSEVGMKALGKNAEAAFGNENSTLFVLLSVAGFACVGFFVCGLGIGSADSDVLASDSFSSAGSGGKSAGVPSAWTPWGNERLGECRHGHIRHRHVHDRGHRLHEWNDNRGSRCVAHVGRFGGLDHREPLLDDRPARRVCHGMCTQAHEQHLAPRDQPFASHFLGVNLGHFENDFLDRRRFLGIALRRFAACA